VNKQSQISGLEMLTDFLNFDFDFEDIGEFREKHRERFSPLKKRGAKKVGKNVQTEVLNDLVPIVSPAKALDIAEVDWLLGVLITKINRLGFTLYWDIHSADYDYEFTEEGREILRKRVKNKSGNLRSDQRELSILNYRWFFGISSIMWNIGLSWRFDYP